MTEPACVRPTVPRWLHGWALLTVCAAVPLVLLGAEVTTKHVGMADTQAVRTPWYLLTLDHDDLWARNVGLLIEHGHRTAGWLVGLCAIVLGFGMWFGARGTGVRAAGWVALALVTAQGLLGIFRVKLNALVGPEMAMIHGSFAQIVFATLVGVGVVTSRTWQTRPESDDAHRLRRLAGLTALLTYAQIGFGALVRHGQHPLAQRAHVLFAFVVVAVVVWLVRSVHEAKADRSLRRAAGMLAVLVVAQLALGVEAWLRRFGAGVPVDLLTPSAASDLVRSLHYFVGALLFAATVALNLLLYRPADVVVVNPATRNAEDSRIVARVGGAA